MSIFNTDRFATATHKQVGNYERRFRKYASIAEIVDTLRRQAAFDRPLKFVLAYDSESAGFRKRGYQWDFGSAGVRFEKREAEDARPVLAVSWSDDFEQKALQDVLGELATLGFDEGAEVGIELVSPSGERRRSRYGNGISVDKDGATVVFTGAWQG